ncbi:MAG: hypothetical protein ABL964_09995 [Steroidobacteraceae bacterium]
MIKNLAAKVQVTAYDYTTGAFKTGDAANITVYVSKDGGAATALTDTSATELDSTNAKGIYSFDVTATESNADDLLFTGKSSTGNVQIVPLRVATIDLFKYGITAYGTLSGTHSTTSCDLGTAAPAVNVSRQTVFWPAHGLARTVSSYDTGTGVATWTDAVDVTLANGNIWYLFGTAPSSSATGLTAAEMRTALGMASANMDTQLGNLQSDSNNIQSRIPDALVAGFIKADIKAVVGEVLQLGGSGTQEIGGT